VILTHKTDGFTKGLQFYGTPKRSYEVQNGSTELQKTKIKLKIQKTH